VTDPRLARDTENGRYYSDPAGGPDLVSVTNVIDSSVSKHHALMPWAVRETIEWMLERRIMVARRAITDRAELVREIKQVHRDVRERAADLGSRVHLRAQAIMLGTPHPADPEVESYARQLVKWMTAWGVDITRDVVSTEITCMHRTLGYAGTADLMIWLPTGPGGRRELWLIDFKTSSTRPAKSVYPEFAMQLAALRFCEVVILPDDTSEPVPAIQRTGILNLRQRSHALVDMPGDKAAWRAFRGALVTTQWLHELPGSHPALLPPEAAEPDFLKAA
jgi:hypothetical protein